jgi:hypothetical protein
VVVAVRDEGKAGEAEEFVRELRKANITTYSSLERACRALSRFAQYHRFRAEMGAGAREAGRPEPTDGE